MVGQGGAVRRNVPGMHSPKRPRREAPEAADVFRYYAGFSYDWAASAIATLAPEESFVLDPWNGSGTVTLAARAVGVPSVGVDLNPAVNVVARARLATPPTATTISAPCNDSVAVLDDEDPLLQWFTPCTSGRLRDWCLLASRSEPSMQALLTVAIFRTVRSLTAVFQGSNPTWVRRARVAEEHVGLNEADLDGRIISEYQAVREALLKVGTNDTAASIVTASSTALPLQNGVVSTIVGSPPYLTRIDYAVAYSRELAILGIDARKAAVRSELMGTTKIRKGERGAIENDAEIVALLERVAAHGSKESAGYYHKQARQYFDDLLASLDEITRVTRPGGEALLVIQDSYYKDIPIPLAVLTCSALERRGWDLVSHEEFGVNRLVTTMNTIAMSYTKGPVRESVVRLKKEIQ